MHLETFTAKPLSIVLVFAVLSLTWAHAEQAATCSTPHEFETDALESEDGLSLLQHTVQLKYQRRFASSQQISQSQSLESAWKVPEWAKLEGTKLYIACGILGLLILGCLRFCFIGGKKKTEEDNKDEVAVATEDGDTIALSDTLLKELMCRSMQRIGPALARGAALQNTMERSIESLTNNAKQLLMSELNGAAGSICQTLDAEEAMLILDWDAAVRANFPAITVLLAGLMAPTLLQMNLTGHAAMCGLLLLPVACLCAWASWQDYGIPCAAIPTIFMWLYVQGTLAAVLCLTRLVMVFQIRAGQRKLEEKAEEFQQQRSKKGKVIGTLGELQELFVSHSVLLQHALLIEESIANSFCNKIVGAGTFVWIVATLWGTVLVLGWTFVPGTVAFYGDAAGVVGATHFCGAWATVFTARLVVIIGVLFFIVNSASAMSWASNLALATPWVQGKARHWAREFDGKFQGIPVMQALFKAFILPRELDTATAELAAELHEQQMMEQEKAEVEKRLSELQEQLTKQMKKTTDLKELAMTGEEKAKMETKLAALESRSRKSMDAGEWKKHGQESIEAARANAQTLEKASTQELERVFNRIREAADQVQNSEQAQEMLRQAKEKGAQAAAIAKEKGAQAAALAQEKGAQAVEVGKQKAKEFSESEEGQQVIAKAKEVAEKAKEIAEEKAAEAQEKLMEKTEKGKKK